MWIQLLLLRAADLGRTDVLSNTLLYSEVCRCVPSRKYRSSKSVSYCICDCAHRLAGGHVEKQTEEAIQSQEYLKLL
jgi:hypothetical protein